MSLDKVTRLCEAIDKVAKDENARGAWRVSVIVRNGDGDPEVLRRFYCGIDPSELSIDGATLGLISYDFENNRRTTEFIYGVTDVAIRMVLSNNDPDEDCVYYHFYCLQDNPEIIVVKDEVLREMKLSHIERN